MSRMRARARRAVLKVASAVQSADQATLPAQEAVYQHLFLRDLAAAGLPDRYYPVGNAANYGLLYLIVRVVLELPVTRVLELGCGQSSLLLDDLAQVAKDRQPSRELQITSVEQDASWAATTGSRVRHPVRHAPLAPTQALGRPIRFYEPDALAGLGKFDFVIVDGPTAFGPSETYNRTGALELLRRHLDGQFVVVFDDAERQGETEAADAFEASGQGSPIFTNRVRAAKQQRVACTEEFRAAAYF